MKSKDHYLAEVVESSLITWKGLCWNWEQVPAFGSLVGVETHDRMIYGIVYSIETGSIDSSRTPFAYQKTEAELKAEQPHIFEFLKSTFNCLTLGYQERGKVVHTLAPHPPKIHSFIGNLTESEIAEFIASGHYAQQIFGHEQFISNIDELLLAHIQQLKLKGLLDSNRLHSLVDAVSMYSGSDYRRMKVLLQRIDRI